MQNRLRTPASTSHIGGQAVKRCNTGQQKCLELRCAMCNMQCVMQCGRGVSRGPKNHIPNTSHLDPCHLWLSQVRACRVSIFQKDIRLEAESKE